MQSFHSELVALSSYITPKELIVGVNHGHEHYADRAFVVVVKAPRFGWLLEDF